MAFNGSALQGVLNERRIAIQRVERAIAIHCHSATSGSDCHFAALIPPLLQKQQSVPNPKRLNTLYCLDYRDSLLNSKFAIEADIS